QTQTCDKNRQDGKILYCLAELLFLAVQLVKIIVHKGIPEGCLFELLSPFLFYAANCIPWVGGVHSHSELVTTKLNHQRLDWVVQWPVVKIADETNDHTSLIAGSVRTGDFSSNDITTPSQRPGRRLIDDKSCGVNSVTGLKGMT